MEETSGPKAQDSKLDVSGTPPIHMAQEIAEPLSSPPAPELMLSLNDLSQDMQYAETNEDDEHKSSDEEESPQGQCPPGQIDRNAKRMEIKLQRSLKQQQAHYARQRTLFENLRADSSPSSNSSNSPQSNDKCRFHKEGNTKIGSLSRERTRSCTHRNFSGRIHESNDNEDDSHAQNMLRRIKERARAEFHRQHLSTEVNSTAEIGATTRSKVPAGFLEEMQQQEVSNDALRRQLELLRRLQLENNRFRQEARSLRERNESLKERDEIRENEVKRLRDEVSELDAKTQRDQRSLATTAQTHQKLKATQKKLTAAQSEIHEFRTALQEARDTRDQLQSESQLEISDLVLEVKRWKRNTKQLRQQEISSAEEIELYKKTIASLEEEVAERRSKLKDAKREINDLNLMVEEKTIQCASVETSAADCVKRMEEDMETLQKTHTHEREKRKKVEKLHNNLQMNLERMQTENALLLDKQRELEGQLTLLQEHWKERKQAYQDQLQRFAAQLEEHVSKHKSDAAMICSLREKYDIIEHRLGEAEAAAIEVKTDVAEEGRTVQKQVEALRKYVERALNDTDDAEDVALAAQLDSGRSRREKVCQQVPELQVVQAAISALRNETMNIVHEFHRVRHVVRQQGSKLMLTAGRATELEHMRAEDAEKMKELREKRKLAEQAREIVSREKVEVLKWSQQNCEKKEELETELKKCGQFVLRLRKELRHALGEEESSTDDEALSAEQCARSFSALQKQVDSLMSIRDHWRTESEKHSHEVKEIQSQVLSLEKELAAKAIEFKESLEEVERVHTKNAHEHKLRFEQCIADMENERTALETKLQAESARLATEKENNAKLQQAVDDFEQDLPVFATILHLFILIVQPLILQVSDLLAQKRYLSRENAEFAQAHEQIECIGQVLKEMIPSATPDQEKVKERRRRRVFRRVVIAVFAMNRFQLLPSNAAHADEHSAYGFTAPLKVVKSRKRASALSSQPTLIKVLHPQQTLSRLSLRPLLERLKKMEITEKVAEVIESNPARSGHIPPSFGNLILKVVMAINPASKEVLVANTNGMFHCQALLERRRRSSRKPGDQLDMIHQLDNTPAFEDDIPTVALIRKRILALGKRVEDLHYQRNSLQKENYEFQFQLDQQANRLKDMESLQKKTDDLQDEIVALRSKNDQELEKTQQELHAKDMVIQSKEDELVKAQAKIKTMQVEVSGTESRIEQMKSEKARLGRELDQMKSSSTEEEEKADKAKAAARRQEEEVRSLKQAVKKAHELYQKVSWQLEQEVQEKSALQTIVNHLRLQQEQVEREVREERLRELEKSFNDDYESDEENEDKAKGYDRTRLLHKSRQTTMCDTASASRTMNTKKKTSFAPSIEIKSPNKRNEALTNTCRRRKCENSIPDVSECVSSSLSVSPLPHPGHSMKPHSSEEVDAFLSEWHQLGVSRALSDNLPPGREVRSQTGGGNTSNTLSPLKTPSSPKNASWNYKNSEKNRRRVEIDKVNAAVHDYMDRIDDKLNKMYGIPPSSAVRRNISMPEKCISPDSRYSRNKSDVDWGVNSSSLKADEVRVHSDLEAYDD